MSKRNKERLKGNVLVEVPVMQFESQTRLVFDSNEGMELSNKGCSGWPLTTTEKL